MFSISSVAEHRCFPSFHFEVGAVLVRVLLLQAVLVGASSPSGQLCGEAAGADAAPVVLQAGGAGEDPAGHAEAERPAAAAPAGTGQSARRVRRNRPLWDRPGNLRFVKQVHRATATILEPTGESDNPLRFTTGLVLALDIDATLEHVQNPQNTVKVQVSPLSSSSDTNLEILFYSEKRPAGSVSRWSESCDPPQTRRLQEARTRPAPTHHTGVPLSQRLDRWV